MIHQATFVATKNNPITTRTILVEIQGHVIMTGRVELVATGEIGSQLYSFIFSTAQVQCSLYFYSYR